MENWVITKSISSDSNRVPDYLALRVNREFLSRLDKLRDIADRADNTVLEDPCSVSWAMHGGPYAALLFAFNLNTMGAADQRLRESLQQLDDEEVSSVFVQLECLEAEVVGYGHLYKTKNPRVEIYGSACLNGVYLQIKEDSSTFESRESCRDALEEFRDVMDRLDITPGPWQVTGGPSVAAGKGSAFQVLAKLNVVAEHKQGANARVMAKGPEFYEFCHKLRRSLRRGSFESGKEILEDVEKLLNDLEKPT